MEKMIGEVRERINGEKESKKYPAQSKKGRSRESDTIIDLILQYTFHTAKVYRSISPRLYIKHLQSIEPQRMEKPRKCSAKRENRLTPAGTVALLTLMTSKLETFRLSASRFITFGVTLVLLIISQFDNIWMTNGLILMAVVFFTESLVLRATISVNSVVAAHLVTSRNLNWASILNELLLVLIGVPLTVIRDLFRANYSHRKQIIANMRKVEAELQEYINNAKEYQDNTFHSHLEYYISYFEMRLEQFKILHRLHQKIKRVRSIP